MSIELVLMLVALTVAVLAFAVVVIGLALEIAKDAARWWRMRKEER